LLGEIMDAAMPRCRDEVDGKTCVIGHKASAQGSDSPELNVISKLQAMFRGAKSRRIHVSRAKAGHKLICPFISSSNKVINKLIDIAHITQEDVVLDLGSGDGRLLIDIALAVRTQHCVGVEIDPTLCATARRLARQANVGHVIDFVAADIATIDLMSTVQPTVIYMFLVPSCLEELSDSLKQLFNQGSTDLRIISYKFPLPADKGWAPTAVIETEDVVNFHDVNATSCIYYYESI
jgi:SAM-dependent methyltransferase